MYGLVVMQTIWNSMTINKIILILMDQNGSFAKNNCVLSSQSEARFTSGYK